MDKLKPCPFCGHEAMISYNSNYDFQAYCTNDTCFMSQIIMEDMETEEQARAAWNKRAPSAPAVPLDKFYELCEETKARVPCAICEKIMPKWCTRHNKPTLTARDWWDCPSWKQILTKWMEEQDAKEET